MRTKRENIIPAIGVGLISLVAHSAAGGEEQATVALGEGPATEIRDEIVVLGSRIKRRDFSAPSPITTFDATDMRFSGGAGIEDLLNQMPQVAPDNGRFSNNPGNGTALVNLRGLGADRTLVMLNGRRFAPAGVESFVDLNALPQGLIERVEIITGGASAVYGSDAVAGVVNFVTRNDWDGAEASARYELSQKGDAQTLDLNFGYGSSFAEGRGHAQFFYNYQERNSLLSAERESEAVTLTESLAGELIPTGSPTTAAGHIFFPPVILDGGFGTVTFNSDGEPRLFNDPADLFSFAPYNYLQTPLFRHSGGAFFNYEFSESAEIYGEVLITNNSVSRQLAPVPANTFVFINTDNPLLTDETRTLFIDNYSAFPGFAAFPIGRRLVELGPRIDETHQRYRRFLVGLRGNFTPEWRFDVYFSRTRGARSSLLKNDASQSRLLQALLVDPITGECIDPSGGCAPADIFGDGRLSAAALEFIRFAPFVNRNENTQYLASAFASGPLVPLPAGSLDIALGVEWRRDSGFFEADPALFDFDALGFRPTSSVEGVESVIESYGEALIPLIADKPLFDYFGLELGGRISNYKSSGLVSTYKYGGEWILNRAIKLRVMRQRSVRAPNRSELFTEVVREPDVLVDASFNNDFCSASLDPVGSGIVENCIASGLDPSQIGVFEASPFYPSEFVGGGNSYLKPETAKTLTAGVVLSPLQSVGFTVSADYFDVKISNVIGGPEPIRTCLNPMNMSAAFCDLITRDMTGNIVEIDGRSQNVGNRRARGVDIALNLNSPAPPLFGDGANFDIDVRWTRNIERSEQPTPGEINTECVGITIICDINTPKNQFTSKINYETGNFQSQLTWRWIGKFDSGLPIILDRFGFSGYELAAPTISAQHYLDLGLSYALAERIEVVSGVNNLLNNKPPFAGAFSTNTDPRLYDVLGRRFYFGIRASL